MTRIVRIGDYDADITAHRTVGSALDLAAAVLSVPLCAEWVSTDAQGDARNTA